MRTKEQLIAFERIIMDKWEKGEIKNPVHFSGGNEEQLINIFKEVNLGDYIFSTHRAHYHYLLAGGTEEELERKIMAGESMHLFDKKLNFLASSIVAGIPCIAAGTALALKMKDSQQKVWCFVGDGAEDNGHFYEAVRYVQGHDLPCKFIIEDNGMSVDTPKSSRHGYNSEVDWGKCVIRYHYTRTLPHVGTGKHVDFTK